LKSAPLNEALLMMNQHISYVIGMIDKESLLRSYLEISNVATCAAQILEIAKRITAKFEETP
jgi:hypothetical protein